jgi:MFS transporter, MHS family, shikimate and dehydroshikimate transport protein
LAMGMRIAENGNFYIITVFVLDYVTKDLGLSKSVGLWGVIIGAAVGLLTIPAYGALSDRLGRRPLYMFGAVFSLLFAFPFFLLLDAKMSILIWLAIGVALWLGHDPMYGPQAAYFSELFGTRLRYSGASIGYQLASVVGGGISPLIAASLLAYARGEPWLIATYVSVYLASETFQEDITAERPEERRAVASAQG